VHGFSRRDIYHFPEIGCSHPVVAAARLWTHLNPLYSAHMSSKFIPVLSLLCACGASHHVSDGRFMLAMVGSDLRHLLYGTYVVGNQPPQSFSMVLDATSLSGTQHASQPRSRLQSQSQSQLQSTHWEWGSKHHCSQPGDADAAVHYRWFSN
jgi:hypothetical protein